MHETGLAGLPAGGNETTQSWGKEGGCVRGLDRVPNLTRPPDDTGKDASDPCPFCGCRHHITAGPGVHAPHRCCGCGRRFDDRRAVCSRCGSPGEHLGDVIAAGRGLYAQYRCSRCGYVFMVQIEDDD